MAEKQPIPKDPIQTRSLSVPIFLATAAMLASFGLAMYDEFFLRRPYKDYQEEFIVVYANYLSEGLLPKQKKALKEITEAPEYVALQEALAREEAAGAEESRVIDAELVSVVDNIARMAETVKVARAKLAALNYSYETAPEDAKASVKSDMDDVLKGPHEVELVDAMGENPKWVSFDYNGLLAKNEEFLKAKGDHEKKKGEISNRAKAIGTAMQEYVAARLKGPHPDGVQKLVDASDARKVGPNKDPMGFRLPVLPNGQILQINVEELNWVDRCESCHVGIREPIEMVGDALQKANEGKIPENHLKAYTSHPNRELLEVHNPEKFGCSLCHGGNGRSVSSVFLAHGLNKHWLTPLHPAENIEAGCVQCHKHDLVLKGKGIEAKTLNEGKWLFYWKGCWGCHKYEGFDKEPDMITEAEKKLHALDEQRITMARAREAEEETSQKSLIDQKMAGLDTQREELAKNLASIKASASKVGPTLNRLHHKVSKEWLVAWIESPDKFKPSTKMPVFRFEPGDVERIAAYIWQHSKSPTNPANQAANVAPKKHQPGDVARGQLLFENRGCLGCHTVQRDGKAFGDGFATDLSRIGDKANYDAVVDWILNPTNGVMPSLRLADQEASDIATYLFSLKTGEVFADPRAQMLEDPKLAAEGAAIIRHFGCGGCHTIDGMEAEGRIGTELTAEGNKPKERLDFGRLEHDFKQTEYRVGFEEKEGGEWTHKHFFQTKLKDPAKFGTGKNYLNPRDKLKMPNFRLQDEQINALTTFLMGSVESELPKIESNALSQGFVYNPGEAGKAIQEGWWIVKKYNCVGCHQFETGVEPGLWALPIYRGAGKSMAGADWPDMSVRRPPSLVGQGFRTDPQWLAKFLRNPALANPEQHSNGVRPYLDIRMPTFRLSDLEIQKLVRFFGALSTQPAQYAKQAVPALDAQELKMARTIFKGVGCVKCHAIGDPVRDAREANAPPLTLMGERMNPPWTIRWIQNPGLLMPGTSMPQNFKQEFSVTLKDGRKLVGAGYEANLATGKGSMKDEAGGKIDFMLKDVVGEPQAGRWVLNPVPDELKGYKGDHIELVTRYLHKHYDVAEIPNGMPDTK